MEVETLIVDERKEKRTAVGGSGHSTQYSGLYIYPVGDLPVQTCTAVQMEAQLIIASIDVI